MIYCGVQDAAIQLSAQETIIFPNRIMKFQKHRRFIFLAKNHKDGPLDLLYPTYILKFIFRIWH